jgi:hypothetical protein
VWQERDQQLMQCSATEFRLRLDARHLSHARIRGTLDDVLRQRRFAGAGLSPQRERAAKPITGAGLQPIEGPTLFAAVGQVEARRTCGGHWVMGRDRV